MPAIRLSAFSGEQPRIVPRLLPANAATSALNARLDDGSLSPYRLPNFVANLEPVWLEGTNLREEGEAFGDLTDGGDLAAAFDDVTAQAAAACASKGSSPTTGFIGRNFLDQPRRIFRAIIFGSNDAGYIAGENPEITVTLYGANEEPDDETDGTEIGALTFTDTADESTGRTIVCTDQATLWQYVWATAATASGTAIHFAELQLIEALPDPFQTIYRHGEDWLAWTSLVHAAPGPVAADRLYYTGDGVPKIKVGNDVFPLAVPRPTTAPTATEDTGGTGDVQTRAYVYTFVTAYGEESEPSPPSNEIGWQSGEDPVLSGIEGDPGGRNITHQRFYRTQTGSVGTDFYFIAERAVSNSNFTDTIGVNEFAEPLPSRHWTAPPDTLSGLTAMPNGMMAGFVGKDLYFCEPFRPHAWPEIYVLTTDFPIVALGALGTTLWVLTEGYPYRVSGTTPGAMVMDKVEASLPCVNARAVVDLGHAIAWPSTEGLAAARANGAAGLVSDNLFSPRAWRRLNPGTMRGGQIEGRWVGSYEATDAAGGAISGSLIIDISQQAFLIRSEVSARAWFHEIGTGFLYFVPPDVSMVRQFDPPNGDLANYYWRSKRFVLPKPENFGAILIESGANTSQDEIDARQAEIDAIVEANEDLIEAGSIGGEVGGETIGATTLAGDLLTPVPSSAGTAITVSVYADGVLVAAVNTLDQVDRLPAGFKKRIWEIDAFGDVVLDQITMASTTDILKQAAGGP
jgi:hypothetical protein